MKKLITIADWAADTLTCQEVASAVEGFLKDSSGSNITFVSSTPSTIHTAFLISQITEIEERYGRPLETVIFQNTDPRLESVTGVEQSKGAEFIIIRLKSGIHVCGPNAGYNFSYIYHKIDEAFVYKGLDKGSQFRSRDLYSRVCAHLMDSMEDELELEELRLEMIPELRGYYIAHIDNFGNIKTTITHEDLKGKYEYGETVPVTINGVSEEAKFVSNLFGGKSGELVMYPGSSGKKDNPLIEITIHRHFTERNISTGSATFEDPRPGMEILLG